MGEPFGKVSLLPTPLATLCTSPQLLRGGRGWSSRTPLPDGPLASPGGRILDALRFLPLAAEAGAGFLEEAVAGPPAPPLLDGPLEFPGGRILD